MVDSIFSQCIGVFGTLAGVFIGYVLTLYSSKNDKKKLYIINAQNVLLILSKQINEFMNIKNYFDKYKVDDSRHLNVKPLLLSNTEWRLSKSDITGLNSGEDKMMGLIFDLIRINDNFKNLLLSIQDYNQYREPISLEISKKARSVTDQELDELKIYLDTIYDTIEKIELLQITERLWHYLQELYPCEKFPKPIIKE